MTINLDLRKRPNLAHPGMAWRDHVVLSPTSYGCADCGQWFTFARDLVLHLCEERDYDSAH